jgi:hypothetical protein
LENTVEEVGIGDGRVKTVAVGCGMRTVEGVAVGTDTFSVSEIGPQAEIRIMKTAAMQIVIDFFILEFLNIVPGHQLHEIPKGDFTA